MERITISLDESLAAEFDALIHQRGYENRSEAIRDVLREYIAASRLAESRAPDCVACVSYVFNHHERELAKRVNDLQHEHHDLTISSMHAHLDHDHCVETVLLRGKTRDVQACADKLLAERGIRHGMVNLIPVDIERGRTQKGHAHTHPHTHTHTHVNPKI